MEVTQGSAFEHYKSLYAQMKNRTISASDAVSQYQDSPFTPDKSPRAAVFKSIDPGAATVWNGFSLLDQGSYKQAAQFVPDSLSAEEIVKQYDQNAGNHLGPDGLSFGKIYTPMSLEAIGEGDFRRQFIPGNSADNPIHHYNLAADDFIKGYASTHSEAWQEAANELGITIDGGHYPGHFYARPEDVEFNFAEGQPKSNAEIIFRHIASDEDIAQFEQSMQPAQEKLDNVAFDIMSDIMQKAIAQEDKMLAAYEKERAVGKFQDLMQDLGIDMSQLATITFGRNSDNSFYVQDNLSNKTSIHNAINGNQEVYDLLDGMWRG